MGIITKVVRFFLKMALIAVLLVVLAVVVLLVLIYLSSIPPEAYDKEIVEGLTPNVTVFFAEKDGKPATEFPMQAYIYPQQTGLPAGARYGFRVLDSKNTTVIPLYKKTADVKEDGRLQYSIEYHINPPIMPGSYVVELIKVENERGVIVASANFTVYSPAERLIARCGNISFSELHDESGGGNWMECVKKYATEESDKEICRQGALLLMALNYSGPFADDCTTAIAVKNRDVSLCEGMPKSVGFCRTKVLRDWMECRRIECDFSCAFESLDTQKDLCVQWYAIETRNESLCSEVRRDDYRQICLKVIKTARERQPSQRELFN